MRTFMAILLLAIVALAAAQTSQDTFVISYLETGQTQPADNDETFETAALENGAINVVITASYPVEVCFQEGYFALGSLDATCNPEGYIPADTSSVLAEENKYNQDGTGGAKKRLLRRALEDTSYTFQYTLYLRDNTQYGVSARWAISDDTDAQNQTGSVQIAVNYTLCPANKNGYGPGCASEPVAITPAGAQATVNAATPAFFTFAISPDTLYNELILTVHFTAATAQTEGHLKRRDTSGSPVQIYARRDAYPIALSNTTTLFDPSTTNTTSSTTNSTSLTFNGPEQGTWFVLVNTASANISYNVNVTVQGVACPIAGTYPTINNASECIPPVQILSANYVPINGSQDFPANGTTFDFSPASGGITYFTYDTAWLLVGVVGASHGSTGAPGIYASATSIPSAASYEVGSDEAAQVNFLNVKSLDDNVVNWIIAVQPLETSDNNGFQIFAGYGCANNCTGRGSCPSDDGADGYCTCNSGYKDFACSTQKLKTIYIVLIAIGGAIVLAIAIGVPVGCYLKNRKRARYERV